MPTMNYSPAARALGFDFGRVGVEGANPNGSGLGNMLQDQVGQETEEERKRRLLGLSKLQTSPLAGAAGSPFAGGASPAGRSLFGGMMK
jgi:hypothetical protein